MINCKNDNLLVKNIPHEPNTRLFIPPEFKRNLKHLQTGKVISAGDGTDVLPMPVKAGDVIVYEGSAGFDIDVDGEKLRALKSWNIICAR